jgi:Bacterial regulatory proteins, luxR family
VRIATDLSGSTFAGNSSTGKSNKEVAALSVSTRTIESHRNHIIKKMNFASFQRTRSVRNSRQPRESLGRDFFEEPCDATGRNLQTKIAKNGEDKAKKANPLSGQFWPDKGA